MNVPETDISRLILEVERAMQFAGNFDKQFGEILNEGTKDRTVFQVQLASRFLELYYNNLETLFIHIKNIFGNGVEESRWHKSLLELMSRETSVRPAVITAKSFHVLDELRGYRHFAKYNFELELYDWERVSIICAMRKKHHADIIADLKRFSVFLKQI